MHEEATLNKNLPFRRNMHDSDEAEYRHRMLQNAVSIIFVAIFFAGVYFTVKQLISIATRPDCNFSVRRPCGRIIGPLPSDAFSNDQNRAVLVKTS